MRRVVFLTRGDEQWGLGHLHRVSWLCAALLAQQRADLRVAVRCLDSTLARGFLSQDALFVGAAEMRPSPVGATPASPDTPAVDVTFHADAAAMLTGLAAGDVVVIDWLDSPAQYVASVRAAVAPESPPTGAAPGAIVLLDDYGPGREQSELAINALLSPLANTETQAGRARVLSGAAYVQLPLAALRLRGIGEAAAGEVRTILSGPPPKVGPVRMVLVSFGGAPKPELIELALSALRKAGYSGKVIVMPANTGRGGDSPPISSGGETSPLPDVNTTTDVEYHPAGDEFHDYLAAADLAILAGGLSLYEAAFFGVPALCIPLVEHQVATARKLETAGCCRLGGMLGKANAEELGIKLRVMLQSAQFRGRMSFRGTQLLDGRGLWRTVDAILELL